MLSPPSSGFSPSPLATRNTLSPKTNAPEAIDDYVSDDNPARFIEAFVDKLDLIQLGFSRTTPAHTGRPAYSPSDLLKLYIYGHLNRTRSSRLLERECLRNLELIWLMRKLRPDFKTIADFRKDNADAIKLVCREFTLICKRLELFGRELIAIDGSKFKAQNNKKRNFTAEKLDKSIKGIDAKIKDYLACGPPPSPHILSQYCTDRRSEPDGAGEARRNFTTLTRHSV